MEKCVKYGSVELFDEADNHLACKSGYTGKKNLVPEMTGSVGIQNVDQDQPLQCLPTPRILSQEGPSFRCASAADTCLYHSSSITGDIITVGEYNPSMKSYSSFELNCECGMTPEGSSFCPHIFTEEYTSLLFKVMSQLSVGMCHTEDRSNLYECLSQQAVEESELELLNEFIVQHYQREENYKIRDNDKCMRKNSNTSQYWEAYQGRTDTRNFHQTQSSSGSNILMKPSFILLVACYLVLAFISYK